MSKLKLTDPVDSSIPVGLFVDAVNECPGCLGQGRTAVPGMCNISVPCPFCTTIRKVLEPYTEEDER